MNSNVGIYGRGSGVGRTRGVGLDRGVGVGLGVAVDEWTVAVAVAVGVDVDDGVDVTVAVGLGVGVGVPVPSSLRQTPSSEGTGKQIVTISARSFDIRDRALRKSFIDRNPRCTAVRWKRTSPPASPANTELPLNV